MLLSDVRSKARRLTGFTLIELTIVIVIMMSAAALVAPLTLKELHKSRGKIEYLQLRDTLKTLTTQAFSRGIGYKVTLVDNVMTITSIKGEQQFEYEYLHLPGVAFFINHNGFPSVDVLTIKVGEQQRQLTIEDMLGVKRDMLYAQSE